MNIKRVVLTGDGTPFFYSVVFEVDIEGLHFLLLFLTVWLVQVLLVSRPKLALFYGFKWKSIVIFASKSLLEYCSARCFCASFLGSWI